MLSIQKYHFAASLEEAYAVLQENRSNTILGGCTFLRLGSKKINTAVDISRLGLDTAAETEDSLEIGAMYSLRQLETNPVICGSFSAIKKALESIVGIQFRNLATVGATVYSKYGFSDLNTVLLAYETEVLLYKNGRMTLKDYINKKPLRDILYKIILPKKGIIAAYKDMRNSTGDYPVLNTAVSKDCQRFIIVSGARPGGACIAQKASRYLSESGLAKEEIATAAEMAADELNFGTNMRGSAEYRKKLCAVLVKRCIEEVL